MGAARSLTIPSLPLPLIHILRCTPGIRGKDAPPEESKPVNVVFLIDISGSMASGDKLPLVKAVLNETLAVLQPTDTVSIVTYASGTGVRLEPTPVSQRGAITAVIDDLTAGGSTAGASGIELAYAQAEAAYIAEGINHVILCTDGDFNVGASSDEALVDLIEEKRQTGITLTVLGFGIGNLNDAMMEAVSNAGDGVYGVITDLDQAIRYVNERMLSTLHFIARDMKIQVEFNPDQVHAYRLLGYENRAIADEDFRDDAVDAGEIGAGHTVTALYELVLAGSAIPMAEGAPDVLGDPQAAYDGPREVGPEDLVLVKVRYKETGAGEADPAYEVQQTLSLVEVFDSYGDADADFRWAISVAAFAELLKGSPYADPAYLPMISEVISAQVSAADPDRAEFVELFDVARGLLGE